MISHKVHFLKNTHRILSIGILIMFNLNAEVLAKDNLLQPELIIIDKSLSEAERRVLDQVARRYYTFWHTGNVALAQAALAPDFIDLNLPQGRPQGPQGPLLAAQQFRTAVPDLQVVVEEMLLVGDRAIGRLRFTGHFTGEFHGKRGTGQAINFTAVDIYRIEKGLIKENWHLEDNLTLLRQLGVVANE